jgi:hypothetical protein
LTSGTRNGVEDILLFDRLNQTMERVSVDPGGAPADGPSDEGIALRGRALSSHSGARRRTSCPGTRTACRTCSCATACSGRRRRVSVDSNGAERPTTHVGPCARTGDARYVALSSAATNHRRRGPERRFDVFLRDRGGDGIHEPLRAGRERGETRARATIRRRGRRADATTRFGSGGAIADGVGIAYLSMDSLVFTTSGEKPTATSVAHAGHGDPERRPPLRAGIALHGRDAEAAVHEGRVRREHHGARLRGGRCFDLLALGSARKSDPARREPVVPRLLPRSDVLGGCPASSTFNATQTGRVTWWP